MKIRPLLDRVLIEVDKQQQETTRSGLFIVRQEDGRNTLTGTVVAVGPGRYLPDGTLVEAGVQEGDRVVFNKYGRVEVNVTDEDGDETTLVAAAAPDLVAVLE